MMHLPLIHGHEYLSILAILIMGAMLCVASHLSFSDTEAGLWFLTAKQEGMFLGWAGIVFVVYGLTAFFAL